MRRIIFIFWTFLSFHAPLLEAQTTIKGVIKSNKNETVPGANIFIKGSYDGASSDENGIFKFKTSEAGEQVLVVSMIGYEPFEEPIKISGSELEVNPKLKAEVTELDIVTISVGSFEASDEKKAVMLRPLDIVTTAGSSGDIYGAIRTLPGTQQVGEQEGLFVRGGAAYESKTIMDNMLIQNPFYSSLPNIAQRGRFNAFMFKGTAFNSGGYSAQYGQALSSVLILNTRDLPPRSSTDIGLMMMGTFLSHTHKWEKSALSLNASYINLGPYMWLFNQRTDWINPPTNYEFSMHYKLKTTNTGMFKFYTTLANSHSAMKFGNLDSLDTKTNFEMDNRNIYVNTSYQEFLNKNWLIFTGFSHSDDKNDLVIDSNNVHQVAKSDHGRLMLTRTYGKFSNFKFGGDFINKSGISRFNAYEQNLADFYSAGFAETDLYLHPKLVMRLGIRYEHSTLLDQTNLAPRFSVSLKTGKLSQVSFATGDFYQTPEDEFTYINKDLDFEKATHYVVNYQIINPGKRTFRIETYYKSYDKLVTGNQSNFNWSNVGNEGDGFAQGVDIFWRDETISKWDYWISYSWVDTKRKFRNFPITARPSFAAEHTTSLVLKRYIPKITTSFGATYTFATGRTYYNPTNPVFLGDYTPNYHDLSVNASYLTNIKDHFTVVFFSLGNALGIENIFSYRYSSDGMRREAIGPQQKRNFFMGMFITIGEVRDESF